MRFLDIQIMLDWSFFNISSCDNFFLFYFHNVKFRLFQDDGLTRQFYNFFLFDNIWSLNFNHLYILCHDSNNFFSLYSLNVNLYNILLIEYRLLCNDSNWTINFDGNFYSLLNWDNLIDFDHPIDYPISNELIWNLVNLFH